MNKIQSINPRDLSEDDLYRLQRRLTADLHNPQTSHFEKHMLHCALAAIRAELQFRCVAPLPEV